MRYIIFLLFSFMPLSAFAQAESNFRNGGAIIIGESNSVCENDLRGALRYNGNSKRFEGCNGADEWSPLAQASVQLGTPLYAASFGYGNPATYNAALEAGIVARFSDETRRNAVRATCMVHESGAPVTTDNRNVSCGRYICLSRTNKWPHMVEMAGFCNAGDMNCSNGDFVIQWNCLTAE